MLSPLTDNPKYSTSKEEIKISLQDFALFKSPFCLIKKISRTWYREYIFFF